MTDEDFLRRWSRRKREVAKAEAEPRDEAKPASAKPTAQGAQTTEPEFDVASLPQLDSINALTDITAFLRAGVPEELTRAALRRVWTADPTIRNFVGLAENAWDFTDPAAMPGFGPLEATEEVRRMVAKVVDHIGRAAESMAAEPEKSANDSKEVTEGRRDDEPVRVAAGATPPDENSQEASESRVLLQSNKVDSAMQHDVAGSEEALSKSSRRSHGGALPR
jgi:hypothetical protein